MDIRQPITMGLGLLLISCGTGCISEPMFRPPGYDPYLAVSAYERGNQKQGRAAVMATPPVVVQSIRPTQKTEPRQAATPPNDGNLVQTQYGQPTLPPLNLPETPMITGGQSANDLPLQEIPALPIDLPKSEPPSLPLPNPNRVGTPPAPEPEPNAAPKFTPAGSPSVGMPLTMPYLPDPHRANTPSAIGGRLELGPNETPLEKAVEISVQLEESLKANSAFQVEIEKLKAKALEREAALAESLREVDRASQEVAALQAEFLSLQVEVRKLLNRANLAEQNELDTLKFVIDALGQLLDKTQPKK